MKKLIMLLLVMFMVSCTSQAEHITIELKSGTVYQYEKCWVDFTGNVSVHLINCTDAKRIEIELRKIKSITLLFKKIEKNQ